MKGCICHEHKPECDCEPGPRLNALLNAMQGEIAKLSSTVDRITDERNAAQQRAKVAENTLLVARQANENLNRELARGATNEGLYLPRAQA